MRYSGSVGHGWWRSTRRSIRASWPADPGTGRGWRRFPPPERGVRPAAPISMIEAVGYAAIECAQEIPAEQTLVLKQDRLFLVTTAHGDITPAGRCSLGLFHDDTRILSHYELRMRGGPPSLLSAEAPRTYSAQVDLAVKDIPFGGDSWDPKHAVHIRRELVLSDRLHERLTLTSYFREPLEYWVELALSADFADIFEVRGWQRDSRGEFVAPAWTDRELAFGYVGRDGRLMRSVLRFAEPPERITRN